MTKPTTLLIDGDIIAFIIACTSQETFDFGEGGVVVAEADPLPFAVDRAKQLIQRMEHDLNATDSIVALSDPSRRYFRHGVFPAYKGTRAGKEPPAMLNPLREVMRGWKCCRWLPQLEADDVLGIKAGQLTRRKQDWIIVTCDKDLRQIAGQHFNPTKRGDVETVTQEQADRWFYQQALSGDMTDGFGGCPGVGPVKAKCLVNASWPNPWPAIVKRYGAAGLDEEHALVMARCARILRYGEYDLTPNAKDPVKLWTPSSHTSSTAC